MIPTARLLDITRLSSRIGRVFTGVDRVELAYLRAVHADAIPDFAIARTALGYVLLDHAGIAQLIAHIDAADFPDPDWMSLINGRLDQSAKVGQTLLRALATRRVTRRRLAAVLHKALPSGFAYLNVGHSNLTEAMLATVKGVPESHISVLVHDTIPLDFPQYQRPGTVDQFAAKLRRVAVHADIVICVSDSGLRQVKRHLSDVGPVPPMVAAHLGVVVPAQSALPADIPTDRPYFVTVGTIEPRKNHALLLDLWERLGPDAPCLMICGARGWHNDAVFRRLDAGIAQVTEVSDLSDGALTALTRGAQASLFPTFAEGFGLPPSEALAIGTPVVCSDLPVLHETLGHNAVYLDPTDVYQWEKEVMRLADADRSQGEIKYDPPTWDAHFKIVFTMT